MTEHETPDGRLLAVARRYEPAVASIAIILVALFVAPRATDGTSGPQAFSAPAPTPSGSEEGAVDVVPPTVPEQATAGAFTRPPATAPRTTTSVAAPPTSTTPPTTSRPPTTRPPAPLTVVGAAWSGSDAGLPFAGFDVPDGALPVSNVLGEPDRRTFVRLAGETTILTLDVVQDGLGSRFPENAAVWLCPVTDGDWEEEPGMTNDEAPEYDCEVHAEGEAGDESWTFDLGSLGNPARAEGFALVAADDAGDFQLLFADPTADDGEG